MVRGLVILGLLGGVGWYAYRKLMGGGAGRVTAEGSPFAREGSTDAGGVTARVTQSVGQAAAAARQVATTAASKARSVVPGSGGGATDQTDAEGDGEPREARAAAMATMQAVQPPATIPEP